MPEVFYDMELEDFALMQKGFFDKRKQDQLQFANVAFCVDAIGSMFSKQRPNYKTFVGAWFGEQPKVPTSEERKKRSEEIMAQLALMQKIQDEKDKLKPKKKNARAVKNNN